MKATKGFVLLTSMMSSLMLSGQSIDVAKLDRFLDALETRSLANGSLTISKNGVIQYKRAIGHRYIGDDEKMRADADTKYRIGSSTKIFTAVVIFQLIEEKRIELDQKLAAYYPNLPNAEKITISDMLCHRSGLHDYTQDTNFSEWMVDPQTHDKVLTLIQTKGSDFEPGSRAEYSNSNYVLLGYIIEKVCKLPYSDVIRKRIVSRLNLKNTSYGTVIDLNNNEAASYKYFDGAWIKEKETNLTIHGGAGSLVSTSADMVMFMDALFLNKLISPSSLLKMQTVIEGYGKGLFQNKYGSKPSLGHNGRIEEFYSALWHFPDEKLTFAYCTNGINFPRTDLLEGVLKICFNESFNLLFSKDTDFRSDELDQYLGTYSSGPIVVNCTKQGPSLLVETKGKVFETEKINEHYFMNAAGGYFFEFFPEKDELHIKETDNVYSLKKAK